MDLKVVSICVATLVWLGSIVSCGLPMWWVTKFLDKDMDLDVTIWEGLWQICEAQGWGSMQCRAYDDLLEAPGYLQLSRVSMVMFIISNGLCWLLCMKEYKCRNWAPVASSRFMALTTRMLFIWAWVMMLLTYSFMRTPSVEDSPRLDSVMKPKLGPSFWLALISWLLLVCEGLLLCYIHPFPSDRMHSPKLAELVQLTDNNSPGCTESRHGAGCIGKEAGEGPALCPREGSEGDLGVPHE